MMPNVPWKRNGPLTFLFTIVSFAACLQKVSSGGIVEVYLQNFTNGNTQGLLTSGVCCDKIGIGFLSTCELNGGCDTYFVVCIDQTTNTGLDDLTTCTFGYTSTELTADTASIVFGNTIGGGLLTTPTPNPLTFSFTSWPNQVLVKVQAWDKDLGLPSEKIDFLMSNPLSITPAGAIAPWTDVTLQNRTTMNLRVRVSCGLNYYGAQCNVLCLPGWQYTCGSDGIKQCSAGWDGANCDQPASGGDVQTTDGGGDQTTDGGGDQTIVDGAVQVTDGVVKQVRSGGIAEVYLQSFTNQNAQLASGVCCDKIGVGFLSTCEPIDGGCDTYFVVCIDQTTNTGLDDLTTCTYGYKTTELTADTASMVFGNTIGAGLLTTSTPNPLTFNFTSWPTQVLIKVQAWDSDIGFSPEKIDFLVSNPLSITPAGAIATWTDVTLQNRTTMNLRVRVRARCELNYYGAQCDVLCLPGLLYTCGSDGEKQCSPGWDGANCDQPASAGGGDQTTDGGGDQTTVAGAVQVTDGVVQQVGRGGIAEVYLQSFTNQNAQLASGVCCDKIGVGFLSTCEPIDGGCDTYFVVCIDQTTNTGLDDLTTCTYGYKTTELTADTASIVFGNTIGAGLLTTSTPNPLTFNFTSWPSQVLIKVQAWDSDIGFSPEKIDFLVSNPLSITPAGAIATWTDVTLQNRTTMNLRVRVRARCELNYYGAQCDVLCLPGLLYTCGSDGEKQCSPGWDGANCDQLASAVGGDQPTDGGGDQTTVAGAVQVTEGVVQQVSGGGIAEVYLQSFTNQNAQLANGVCCDKIGVGFLSTCEPIDGGCDTYFVVCIDQTTNTGLDDLTTCTYGYKTTELTADTASMVFGNTIGGGLLTTSTPNPLTFNFASWPSQVLVKVQAWDSDIGFSPEKIDFLVSNPLSITPAGAIATWTDVTLQNRTTMNLRVRVRVRCGLNYYGAQCNVLCLPGLQYTCDSDGVKQCSPGWAGANCDKPASAGGGAQPTVGVVEQVTTADCGGCANNGQCIGGSCSCATGYTGAKCDQIAALCQVNLCQNGGSCQQSGVVTSCSCAAGWTGPRCERDIDECSNNVCRNSGACQNTNGGFVCTCLPGWTGQLCDVNINDYSSSSPDGTEKSRVLKFGQKLTKEQIWFILYSISRRVTALDAGQSTSTAFVYYQVIYYYDKSSGTSVEQTLLLYRVTRGGQAITSNDFYSEIESDVSSQSSQSSLTFSSGGDEKDFESEIEAAAAGQTGEMPMSELRRRLDVGAIIVIAFIIAGLIIGALVIFICRQRKQKWEIDSQTMDPIQTLEIKEVTTEACGGISGPDDDNRVNSAQLTIDCGETQQTTSPNIYVITKHKHGHHHHHHPSRSGSSSSSSSSSSGSRSIYDQIREGR